MLWHDEADPEKRQFASISEMLAANEQFNRDENKEKAEIAYKAYVKASIERQTAFCANLAALRSSAPDHREMIKLSHEIRSKAGQNQSKKGLFEELNRQMNMTTELLEERILALDEKIEEEEDNVCMTHLDEAEANKFIERLRRQFDSLQARFDGLFVELSKLVPAQKGRGALNPNRIVRRGAYGVMTAKAYDSIPAPFNDRVCDYLSTMARAHGQPGIHLHSDGVTAVLKFLGVLGDKGIFASGMKDGKYLFDGKLGTRH